MKKDLVNGQSASVLYYIQVIEGLHILEKWYTLSTFEKKLTELVLFSDQP